MAKSRAQQAAIAISMKKAGKKPKSLVKAQKGIVADNTKVANSYKNNFPKEVTEKKASGPDYRNLKYYHWTDDSNTKQDSLDYKKGYYRGAYDITKGKPKSKTLYNPDFGTSLERLGYSEAYERKKSMSSTSKLKTGKNVRSKEEAAKIKNAIKGLQRPTISNKTKKKG
jgi:hypothetical protein